MKITRRKLLKFSAAGVIMAGCPAIVQANTNEVRAFSGPAFGSAWRLVMADSADCIIAQSIIKNIVSRIDGLMSPFRADSELSRFNWLDVTAAPVGAMLSDETILVTKTALEISHYSYGAFDPTIAPIGRRFGFGANNINPARPAGHYADLEINGNELKTVRPGLSLDLCAIAKGYALDAICNELSGLNFLLELGGEIAARGHHPSGREWLMGIDSPNEKKIRRIIKWDGRALATSGNEVEGYNFSGNHYGHVINPKTALPVSGNTMQVSVLAPTAMLADGLATAALVMGPDGATEMLKQFDASALFLVRDDDGATMHEVEVLNFSKGPNT